MVRDFTEQARQELLDLVEQVEKEKWCDFTDWLGDRWYDFQEWIGKLDIKNYVDNVNAYHKKVIDKNNTTSQEINRIFQNINAVSTEYTQRINAIHENICEFEKAIKLLEETISPQIGAFTSQNHYPVLRTKLAEYFAKSKELGEIATQDLPDENPAFDDEGAYGGNQGSAMKVYKDKDIQKIVREYHPEYSDKEIKQFLEKMNSEGCGYVAMCNTIFAEFVGREEEFERIFGYPMYKNGDLNYDTMIVDFYCAKDNENRLGTNWDERERMWESFMAEHGIGVDVVCGIDLTIDTYDKISEQGAIVVAISPVILEDKNGTVVFESGRGHAMTITGVTSDGRYVVSSWGKKYYIDPNTDFDRLQFQQVRY